MSKLIDKLKMEWGDWLEMVPVAGVGIALSGVIMGYSNLTYTGLALCESYQNAHFGGKK